MRIYRRFVDGKLAEQEHRHGIGAVALLRFRQKGALDLRGTEYDIADDSAGRRIGNDGDAGRAARLIGPSVTLKPPVDRVVEPVWAGRKRKLEKREQRLATEIRRKAGMVLPFSGPETGTMELTQGHVAGSHVRANSAAETAVAG